jgi:hypothetical protein
MMMATMKTESLTYGKARAVSGDDDDNGGKSGNKQGKGKGVMMTTMMASVAQAKQGWQ